MPEPAESPPQNLVLPLSKAQRRVLGTLLEKGMTTPEYYPLTLKAVVTGCNQKSNRDPIVTYDEDQAEQYLDQLRELGLVAIVHTDSGRSARFRHYMRHKYTLSEPQLAILTELLLRGRQSIGDLRSRATRMVAIDTLEQLRTELNGLMDLKLVVSDGSLDRRGAIVDHNLYTPSERQPWAPRTDTGPEPTREPATEQRPAVSAPAPVRTVPAAAPAPIASNELAELSRQLGEQQSQTQSRIAALEEEVLSLREQLEELSNRFAELKQSLGG